MIGSDLGGVPLSTGQESGLVSSALVGALLGSLLSGRVGDKWGRKPAILTAAVLFALGGEWHRGWVAMDDEGADG